MLFVHPTKDGSAAETVLVVMENLVVTDVDGAVIRHLSVLHEEDVALLRFLTIRQANQTFTSEVVAENVHIAFAPVGDAKLFVEVQTDSKFAAKIVATQGPAVENAERINAAGVRHLESCGMENDGT